jgi:hypothetical protein
MISCVNPDVETYQRCLICLQAIIPSPYSQWLVEDSHNHDYRVVASIVPDGADGYDTAHRTGIIGQVFRTEKPILALDVRKHPLYDPFDSEIDWELCFPVFADGKAKAVINLEGAGELSVDRETWDRLSRAVEEVTQCRPPALPPQADSPCLIETHRIVLRADGDDSEQKDDIVALARALARGGESTLLVGHYPALLHGRGPTMMEAGQQGLSVSYCYFGVEPRLDLLATGPLSRELPLKSGMEWWNNCRGRYAFVLLDTDVAERLSSCA